MGWQLLLTIAGGVVTVGGAAALTWKTLKRINDFLDDWNGEPARPGVVGREGVMPRLAKLEGGVDGLNTRLENVEARTEQLSPNGGSSMRDQVTQIVNHIKEAG